MSSAVKLQAAARFGKRDGASEYQWQFGRDSIPTELLALCEPLAQLSASTRAYFSLVAESVGANWLARTYFQGSDNSFRTIAAVEVAKIIYPPQLSPEQQLILAAVSAHGSDRGRAGEAENLEIELRAQITPQDPDPGLLLKARIGLPITAELRTASFLTRQPYWRYRGVCYATESPDGALPNRLPGLKGYLCVNFDTPDYLEEEMSALNALRTREVQADEWEVLDQLDPARVYQALRWSVDLSPPCPVGSPDDPLCQWLLILHRAENQGADLLKFLRHDLKAQKLPLTLIRDAVPELSDAAAEFLANAMQGERPGKPLEKAEEVLEELARDGYLADAELVPLKLWAEFIPLSQLIASQAVGRFVSLGCEPSAARFVLDLEIGNDSKIPHLEALQRAIRIAVENEIPAPRRNLMRVLSESQRKEVLETFSIYQDERTQAIFRMALKSQLASPEILTNEEMLAALEFRRRVLDIPWAGLDVLSELAQAGRMEEARKLFSAIEPSLADKLQTTSLQILKSRLHLGAPALPDHLTELHLLQERDLACPSDIIPPEDIFKFVECAGLWPETVALAALLAGEKTSWPDSPPEYPAHWKEPLRRVLPISRIAKWLKQLQPDSILKARVWVARLYELDWDSLQAIFDGVSLPPSESLRVLLPWLPVFLAADSREQRLHLLTRMASGRLLTGDDQTARQVARTLLPEDNAQTCKALVHALSLVGPPPALNNVSADVVQAICDAAEPLAAINYIFSSDETSLSGNQTICQTLYEQVCAGKVAYPKHGYTRQQIEEHAPLAEALSKAPGWEPMAPTHEERTLYARQMLRRLNLEPAELASAPKASN